VIGILIALQINNWNTTRQEHAELHGYLNNIKKNIEFDLANVNSIMAKRDTISANCQAILALASRDSLSLDDLFSTVTLLGNENNNIYVEFYFIPDQSGFEVLKSSGFLGKLNGTILESKLYEYNYTLKQIAEQERSLNEFVERMEAETASNDIWGQLVILMTEIENDLEGYSPKLGTLRQLINHPPLKAGYVRGAISGGWLKKYYNKLISIGEDIVKEIDVVK